MQFETEKEEEEYLAYVSEVLSGDSEYQEMLKNMRQEQNEYGMVLYEKKYQAILRRLALKYGFDIDQEEE